MGENTKLMGDRFGKLFVDRLVKKHGIRKEFARKLVLPEVGEEMFHKGVVYKAIYVSPAQMKVTIIPIRLEMAKTSQVKLNAIGFLGKCFDWLDKKGKSGA